MIFDQINNIFNSLIVLKEVRVPAFNIDVKEVNKTI